MISSLFCSVWTQCNKMHCWCISQLTAFDSLRFLFFFFCRNLIDIRSCIQMKKTETLLICLGWCYPRFESMWINVWKIFSAFGQQLKERKKKNINNLMKPQRPRILTIICSFYKQFIFRKFTYFPLLFLFVNQTQFRLGLIYLSV